MHDRNDRNDISTDQRLLLVVLRMATDEDLPRERHLRELLTSPKLPGVRSLLTRYREEEVTALQAHYYDKEVEVETLVTEAFKATARAADLAYGIRFLAQGTRGTAPSVPVWELLVAALTVLVLRAPKTSQKHALTEKVTQWTSRLEGL